MNPALPGGASIAESAADDTRWSASARLAYAFVPYRELQQGRETAPNPTELAVDVHLATLGLGLAAPTGTSFDLQLPTGTLATSTLDAATTTRGIGDLEARVRQSFARWAPLGGALGIVVPTGEYVARSGAANLPPEASYLTLGRGVAWGLVDLDARYAIGRTLLFAALAGRVPLTRTDDEFEWGAELRTTITARGPIAGALSYLASADLQWRGGASEPDPFTGERAMSANAGGWQATLSPGLAYALPANFGLVAGARIPIYTDVTGNQLVPGIGAFAALSYTHVPARPRIAPPRAIAGQITVVDYWATWCAPCAEIDRALAAAASRWPDVRIVKVDATAWPGDGAPALPTEADGLPVVEIFDADGKRHALLRGTDALQVVDVVDRLRTSTGRK